eukprot:SAG31_NODE_41601_length_275_cov_0.818182_1_plen_22_part_01
MLVLVNRPPGCSPSDPVALAPS